MTDEKYLTTRDASEATGYHASHFNNIILQGKLAATKDESGRWQIKQSDLDQYLATKSVKPRRDKKYITAKSDKPETSLLTQLDVKTKELENVQMELDAAKRILEDTKAKHLHEIETFRTAIKESENKLSRAKNRIESLKEENDSLYQENLGHVEFLRTSLSDLLKYVTK